MMSPSMSIYQLLSSHSSVHILNRLTVLKNLSVPFLATHYGHSTKYEHKITVSHPPPTPPSPVGLRSVSESATSDL